MELAEAIQILRALSDGVDPRTGERADDHSPWHDPEVVRALHCALDHLPGTQRREGSPAHRPARTGAAWTEKEDAYLAEKFGNGVSVKDLAAKHRRSTGAIRSRLVKLGLIEPDPSAGFRPPDVNDLYPAIVKCVAEIPGLSVSGVAQVLCGSSSRRVAAHSSHELFGKYSQLGRSQVVPHVHHLVVTGKLLVQGRSLRVSPSE